MPPTPVFLWVAGEQLRAGLDTVVCAEYHGQYNAPQHTVMALCNGVLYPTRFASLQGTWLPRETQRPLVVHAPQRPRQASHQPAAQQ